MPHSLSGLKILLVEDQEEMRAMIKTMLSEEMLITQVFEAANGGEALDFIKEKTNFIDIIMCDWNMPQMTGLELLQKTRKIDPKTPFLMVTGRSDSQSVLDAKEAGVTAYIRKPFTAKQLEAKLRIILFKIAS